MARLELIALNFEKFTDGRPYSAARLLRERMGYRGRLRATGEVLVDQYAAMRRCGFDSFVVAKGRALRSWQAARIEMSVRYQAPQESVLERRHARRAVLEVA